MSKQELAVTLLVVGLLVAGAVLSAPASFDEINRPEVHVVSMGDTLWNIAVTYWTPADHRGQRVHWLKEINPHLGDTLQVGDIVRLEVTP